MNTKTIQSCLERNEIPYCDELTQKIYIYFSLLQEWNNRMDLTAVSDEKEMLDKHFVDSLTVLKTCLIKEEAKLIDVGTGAGFPGMVLAMACPKLQVTLLDAQQKRLKFIETVSKAAGVSNVSVVHARAEDGARKTEMREKYDYAIARAVAPMNILCEYLLPYVRIGGYALCWKGPSLKDELDIGSRAARILGGQPEIPVHCTVEGREWDHTIMPIKKIIHTSNEYPRKAGTPKSRPLGL